LPVDAIAKEEKDRPKTDRCGTSHRISSGDDADNPVRTNWRLPTAV